MGKIEALPTERLILRELTIDDFHSIHVIKSNAAVVKYLTWGATTEEETRNSHHWNKGIYATCDVENEGSIKVLKSCGFRLEADFKKDLHVKGEWRDNFLFAKLQTENAVLDI